MKDLSREETEAAYALTRCGMSYSKICSIFVGITADAVLKAETVEAIHSAVRWWEAHYERKAAFEEVDWRNYKVGKGCRFNCKREDAEFCCSALEEAGDIQLNYIDDQTDDTGTTRWYGECPFCKSVLVVEEYGLRATKFISKPDEKGGTKSA